MSTIDEGDTFRLGDHTVKRVGYGAMEARQHLWPSDCDPEVSRSSRAATLGHGRTLSVLAIKAASSSVR